MEGESPGSPRAIGPFFSPGSLYERLGRSVWGQTDRGVNLLRNLIETHKRICDSSRAGRLSPPLFCFPLVRLGTNGPPQKIKNFVFCILYFSVD